MQLEYLIFLLTFAGIFVFVIGIFPAGNNSENKNLPWWLATASPLAELFSRDIGKWLEQWFFRHSSKLQKLCGEAGLNWTSAYIYGLQTTLALIVFLLAGSVVFLLNFPFSFAVPLILAFTVCGWFCPELYVRKTARKRLYEISRILPFSIDLICSSMSAGLDFVSAIRYYNSLNFNDPLSLEFNTLLREIELGKSRSDALRNMAERIRTEEFDRFVSAIIYSLESGTAIIEVMQLQADEVRRIRFANMEQQIAKVPSKMLVPIIICIVPAMFIMILVPVILSVKDIGLFQAIFK